jgi:hypothetical protein
VKVFLVAVALLLSGCTNVLLEPSQRIHDHQLKKYIEYVENDESLSDRDKRYQRELIERYGDLLKEVRNESK